MKNLYQKLSRKLSKNSELQYTLYSVGLLFLAYLLYLAVTAIMARTREGFAAAQCIAPYKPDDQSSVETEVVVEEQQPNIPICPSPSEPVKPVPIAPPPKAKTEYVCQCPDCDAKCPYTFPDLSKYVLKSSIPPCPATPDLSKYILKTDVPKCVTVDKSKYILKSEVPDCVCPDCPACNCAVPDVKICTDMLNGNGSGGSGSRNGGGGGSQNGNGNGRSRNGEENGRNGNGGSGEEGDGHNGPGVRPGGESIETEVEVENRGGNAGGLTPSTSVVTDYVGSANGGTDDDATIYMKGFQGGGGNFGGVDDNYLIMQEK